MMRIKVAVINCAAISQTGFFYNKLIKSSIAESLYSVIVFRPDININITMTSRTRHHSSNGLLRSMAAIVGGTMTVVVTLPVIGLAHMQKIAAVIS